MLFVTSFEIKLPPKELCFLGNHRFYPQFLEDLLTNHVEKLVFITLWMLFLIVSARIFLDSTDFDFCKYFAYLIQLSMPNFFVTFFSLRQSSTASAGKALWMGMGSLQNRLLLILSKVGFSYGHILISN